MTFVLNGLPDDVEGALLKNNQAALTWEYIYNACEGLDCSNRVNVLGYRSDANKEDIRENQQANINMGEGFPEMEVCRISEKGACFYCKKPGHLNGNLRND